MSVETNAVSDFNFKLQANKGKDLPKISVFSKRSEAKGSSIYARHSLGGIL